MSLKPELLFLSHRLPTPPHNGAAIRTYNIIRVLSESYRVTALCFDRLDPVLAGLDLEERIKALRPYADVEVFPIPQQHSRVRFLMDHARSVLTGEAYTLFAYDSSPFADAMRRALALRNFALVHVDTLDLARHVALAGALPVACTHHNVESQLLRRRARTEPAVRRAYLEFQADKLERLERYWLPRVALNIAVSEDDARLLRSMAPTARVEVIPNGVDVDYFRPRTVPQDGCVFVGGTNWFPNRDGLEWFHGAALAELRALDVRAPVTWVGRCTDDDRRRFGDADGVRFAGYVPDVRPFLDAAACVIAPLRVGGGTRLKILDAWACGKAVVSTTQGCEGLRTIDGGNILIADEPRAFAQAIRRVLDDAELRGALGRAGRDTVERHYGWAGLGRELCRLYAGLSDSSAVSGTSISRSA